MIYGLQDVPYYTTTLYYVTSKEPAFGSPKNLDSDSQHWWTKQKNADMLLVCVQVCGWRDASCPFSFSYCWKPLPVAALVAAAAGEAVVVEEAGIPVQAAT